MQFFYFTNMRIFCCVALIVNCYCMTTLAYPMDYNETTIQETDAALNNLRETILKPKFPLLLDEFLDQIVPVSLNVFEELTKLRELYSYRLIEVQENAKNINANLSQCGELNELPGVDEIHTNYETDCAEVARAVGKNIIAVGYSIQQSVFMKKYSDLMHYYRGCLSSGDPAPMICVGVISSTLEGVRKTLYPAQTYASETERNLKQELVNLSECANGKISDASHRIHSEFEKVINCVFSSVVVV